MRQHSPWKIINLARTRTVKLHIDFFHNTRVILQYYFYYKESNGFTVLSRWPINKSSCITQGFFFFFIFFLYDTFMQPYTRDKIRPSNERIVFYCEFNEGCNMLGLSKRKKKKREAKAGEKRQGEGEGVNLPRQKQQKNNNASFSVLSAVFLQIQM